MPSCFSTACSTDMPGVGCTPSCWANLYVSRREGMADLGGGGYGLQQDASVVELLFGYLHEESPSVSIVKRSL